METDFLIVLEPFNYYRISQYIHLFLKNLQEGKLCISQLTIDSHSVNVLCE